MTLGAGEGDGLNTRRRRLETRWRSDDRKFVTFDSWRDVRREKDAS
jgi:hypothetical protein